MDAEVEGFAQFVEARQRALQRTAWLLTGDWALAEDLVQTALVRSWPRWERINRRDDPEIYVRRAMVNSRPRRLPQVPDRNQASTVTAQCQRPRHKEIKVMKRKILLSLAAAPGAAVLISACASAAPSVAHSNLTVQCTENVSGVDVTNGGVAGTGRCALTGGVHDSGRATDYRTQNGLTAIIRRVITGAKGTITFVITINLSSGGGEPWKITSGTKTYTNLHGRGYQVVDNYAGTPATFVLKGTVSQSRA